MQNAVFGSVTASGNVERMEAQSNAIANADAMLTQAKLPDYTEMARRVEQLTLALRSVCNAHDWVKRADAYRSLTAVAKREDAIARAKTLLGQFA